MTARLLSINVGLPRDVPWRGQTVHTAVWKTPIQGRRRVRRLNIDGDGQGDLIGHGGEQRAVLVYQIDSYHYWQRQLSRDDFAYGQFGENFTVEQVSAGGPERMTVSEVSALLYMPGHPRDQVARALRIPALSAGWQTSFR